MNLNLSAKKTRKQVFLEQVVPWAALVELIAPYYPEGRTGRLPFSLLTMLRIHFMQQCFSLSAPAMEDAFFDMPLYRELAQFEEYARLPDESTILRFLPSLAWCIPCASRARATAPRIRSSSDPQASSRPIDLHEPLIRCQIQQQFQTG